ncbi:uncharacterized protein DUF3859 [Litoreibacter ponti]|uniref:Uncharacterized protein DUF3859 n=1 Tax=Litoreibacter ponti TaxID=1510457 RepID=A0A2T6BMR3_9RHOB|nr:DUF3859 domain-containing protein [Litoreibacter ponti]PTX57287.1 uncharacterized protein DUF3859 [Litoreibacter ponti]
MIRAAAALSILILGLWTPAQAQRLSDAAPEVFVDRGRVTDLDFGLVCPAGPARKLPAPGTHLGHITQREAWQKVEFTTQTIPLIKGVGFGVDVNALPDGDMIGVEVTVTHPPYPGTDVTRESWVSDVIHNASNLNFFLFEHDFEMVPGRWSFEARYGSALLFAVDFNVVDPDTVPHLKGVCRDPALLS